MAHYVASVDQGTTSTRCMVFNHAGEVICYDQKEHQQIYPKPGWVEHDPEEIWERTQTVIRTALQHGNIDPSDVAAMGITNQRETTVVWNKKTGKPYYNALVWQDTRTDKICAELEQDGGQNRFRAKVGLPLATYFSGPKIRWLLDNVDGLRADAERGDAAFGKLVDFLEPKLTAKQGQMVKVGRFFPSSKTCSHCGSVREHLALSE
ncbi:MAG: glycerol kinase, partial [Chloroflexaceae bacterium]|nr:glycerol kinase [Chloroflexaceae bacterium]